MKNASPYTGKWLWECFPEQTKSVKSICIWTFVYIVDTILVFWLAAKLGIHQAPTLVANGQLYTGAGAIKKFISQQN